MLLPNVLFAATDGITHLTSAATRLRVSTTSEQVCLGAHRALSVSRERAQGVDRGAFVIDCHRFGSATCNRLLSICQAHETALRSAGTRVAPLSARWSVSEPLMDLRT